MTTYRTTQMTESQAWYLFHQSPVSKSAWEHTTPQPNPSGGNPGHGLLLPICPHCHHAATRQTYVSFWEFYFTLIQDYVITALVRCPNCHKYCKHYG